MTINGANNRQRVHLVLADGRDFPGFAIGATESTTGETVFTTGMTGYQEVLTDPSYTGQLVTMTAPHIGNTGVNADDVEGVTAHAAGFIVHELSPVASSWRATTSLDSYLNVHGIVGIAGVDTRALTRHLRDHGAQMAAIGPEDVATLCDRARAAPAMSGRDLTREVSTKLDFTWTTTNGPWRHALSETAGLHVVAVDFGVKRNILRNLVEHGCKVTVVPGFSTAEAILAHRPDGIFLSNGPGDPAAVTSGIAMARALLRKKPMFGVCLGHQILALALGGSSYKLKFGHRGLNQPVHDLETRRIEVTAQNHGFCVDVNSLQAECQVTHLHLNDGTCEGIRHKESDTFGVQFHPEASAGPHDSQHLFARFVQMMLKTA